MHKCYGPYHAAWDITTTIKPGESGGHNLTVRLTSQQYADHYELILNRHRASTIITSNRAIDEWLGLFEHPILGNSALDRLANASYQIVIKGSS